jgi:succinate-semialdehyde dehydrogenase/glutarate-semialdehyde dehydrogenase
MLVEKIRKSIVIGDPMDRNVNLGPLVTEGALDKLNKQIQKAIKEGGAKHVYGDLDIRATRPELAEGNYTDAIILEGMDHDSHIYKEEFFGPVFNLFKVANSKEAMDLANKSDYGLSATVFTDDLYKARQCAHRMRSGTVFINECGFTNSDFPSGGIKGSGYGRECYSDGLHDTANRKTIIYKK